MIEFNVFQILVLVLGVRVVLRRYAGKAIRAYFFFDRHVVLKREREGGVFIGFQFVKILKTKRKDNVETFEKRDFAHKIVSRP